jgi:hypothetical protein
MKIHYRFRFVVCMVALLVVAGCASTKVTDRQPVVTGQIQRPGRILVYDFAATPNELPPGSALAVQYSGGDTPRSAEHVATGRKLGALIAEELTSQIREMGMLAEHASLGTTAELNDIVIRGCIISYDEGSAAKRVTIGLGAGSSQLRVAAEGLQMTPQGLRTLGYGATQSGGSKTPGAAVGAATFIATANPAGLIVSSGMKVYGEASGSSKVEGRAKKSAEEIADVLKRRFKDQGWIE